MRNSVESNGCGFNPGMFLVARKDPRTGKRQEAIIACGIKPVVTIERRPRGSSRDVCVRLESQRGIGIEVVRDGISNFPIPKSFLVERFEPADVESPEEAVKLYNGTI